MLNEYFVIDKQGSGFREGIRWSSVEEIADSLRRLDEFEENNMANLSDLELCEIYGLECHLITPENCEKFGVNCSELK